MHRRLYARSNGRHEANHDRVVLHVYTLYPLLKSYTYTCTYNVHVHYDIDLYILSLHTGAVAQCCAHYGQGSGPVQVQNIVCSGSEPTISECSHSGTPGIDHSMDIGVQCQPKTATGTHTFVHVYTCVYMYMYMLCMVVLVSLIVLLRTVFVPTIIHMVDP